MELFSQNSGSDSSPLAYRMSPRSLDEYIGQDHIVGKGRLLRRVIQADRLSSLIFYGPPGTGKTSLARVIAGTTNSAFTSLNAVLTGVKELREEIHKAKERRDLHSTRSILFVDEVHRWNKAQQDALLPWVENGTIVLIGATTHNPYFEVNPALVSRSRIFQLTALSRNELFAVAWQALGDPIRGYGNFTVEFEEGALEHLVDVSSGDARSLLNALELAIETSSEEFPPRHGEKLYISFAAAEESIQQKAVLYDKEGDYHFDVISAFIKSVRGSDPDAALYWLAKMVYAGEDPRFIFRRMLISAGEDVGMADPYAITVVEAAASAFDRVGMPEGRYHLAHAALYLSTTKKSNSSLGFFDALESVTNERSEDIPRHLKDANRDKEGFGHGEGYLYPHAYREHWVAQQYLPSNVQGRVFFRPSEIGYEGRIKEEVDARREAHLAAMIGEESPEVLSYSPPDQERERWLARVADQRSSALLELREIVFEKLMPARHHRILDLRADDGLFLWEALRKAPEGGVTAIVTDSEKREYLESYAGALDMSEQPELYLSRFEEPGSEAFPHLFDRVVGKNCSIKDSDKTPLLTQVLELLEEGGRGVLAEAVPAHSPRLSQLIGRDDISRDLFALLKEAETLLYEKSMQPHLSWEGEELRRAAEALGFSSVELHIHRSRERRLIKARHIESWLSAGGSGAELRTIGDALLEVPVSKGKSREEADEKVMELRRELSKLLSDRHIAWHTEYAILCLEK